MPKPRKRFGQHFLWDKNIIHRIIHTFALQPKQHIVEIGPGRGALTFPLLDLAQEIEAIEFDRDLISFLSVESKKHGNLILHEADALSFDYAALKTDARPLRIIGNLPYNISTPLLFHLLQFNKHISDMLFMLQKEVAERIAAPPNSAQYGRLSVMMQYHCQTQLYFIVPPEAFHPAPLVQSQIIYLKPHLQLIHCASDYTCFSDVVRLAFNQRRKNIRNSLATLISEQKLREIGMDPSLRAENLSVKDFVTISNAIASHL